MGGLFNRVKNWIGLETVTPSDLNDEFNNIIQHYTPQYMDDYSATVSQMQETLSPGAVSSEVQATNLAEELKQLRYMVKAITGGAQWYTPPTSNLSEIASLLSFPNHRIVSGRVDAYQQPMWLQANGAAATVSLLGASTNLVTVINGTQVTFNTNLTKTSLTLAPSSNNTCLVNETSLAGQEYSKTLGEADSVISIDNVGSEISTLNGTRAAFKIVHGGSTEYFTADIDTTNGYLKNCSRGFFFSSADANMGRIAIHDNDTITLMKLTWVFGTYNSSTLALDVVYTQPSVSYDSPSAPATGDYWFDMSANRWKKYSGSFSATNAVFLGVCFQDSANCLGSRSVYAYREFSGINGIVLERTSNSVVRSSKVGSVISVYGNRFSFDPDNGSWDMTANLDAGVTEAASTTYYFYISSLGKRIISDVAPYDSYAQYRGAYHPFRPYRCVGSCYNDGSSNLLALAGSELLKQSGTNTQGVNFGLRWAVSGNALTGTLTTADGSDPSAVNPIIMSFRVGTSLNTDGYNTQKRITQPLSVTIPNTATLGTTSAVEATINFYAGLTDKSRLIAVVSGLGLGTRAETIVNNLIDMTTGSDSKETYYGYKLSGETYVCVFPVARLASTQASAGVWATLPTNVQIAPRPALSGAGGWNTAVTGNGSSNHGTTDTAIRRIGSDATQTVSDALGTIFTIVTNAANGTIMTVHRTGTYFIQYEDRYSGGTSEVGLSLDCTTLTTAFASITAAEKLSNANNAATYQPQAIYFGRLSSGQKVRPHDAGNNDNANVKFQVTFVGDG